MKKIIAILLLVVLIASSLVVTACKNDEISTSSSSQIIYQTSSKKSSSTSSQASVDTSAETSESDSESITDSDGSSEFSPSELIGIINSIGEVNSSNFSTKISLIEQAEAAYNKLSEEEKSMITNHSFLVLARNTYDMLKTEYDAKMQLVDAFKNAVSLIENYQFTTEYEQLLNAASNAYDAIDSAYLSYVTTEKQLLDERKAQYSSDFLGALPKEVKDAIILIDAIGTVTSSNFASKLSAIEAAENAYNLVSSGDKASVTNYNLLQTARQNYNQFYQAEQTILLAINDFKTKVSEIETFEDSTSYKLLLDAAVSAYNVIPTERRNEVSTEKATLDARNQTYNDTQAVKAFILIFNALPQEAVSQENRSQFENAINSFKNLSSSQKDMIDNSVKTAISGFETEVSNLPKTAVTYIAFDGTDSSNTPNFNSTIVSYLSQISYVTPQTSSGKIGSKGYARAITIAKTTSTANYIQIKVPANSTATVYFTGSAASTNRYVFLSETITATTNTSIGYYRVTSSGGNAPSEGTNLGSHTINGKTYESAIKATLNNSSGQSEKSWYLCASNDCYITLLIAVVD